MAIKYYTRSKARLALASCTLVLFGNCHFSTPRKFDYKKMGIYSGFSDKGKMVQILNANCPLILGKLTKVPSRESDTKWILKLPERF